MAENKYGSYTTRDGHKRRFVTITDRDDVTAEVLEVVEDIHDGWYSEGRIDWEDFLERVDGTPLDEHDGREIDLGGDPDSPAIRAIKRHIRNIRNA